MLGVLGGMGPLATVDFLKKVIENTPASCDQEHIEIVVRFATQTPDRTSAILGHGEDPYPSLQKALRSLEQSGADIIAIPCNTAHYWHAALQKEAKVPILHIVDAVVDLLEASGRKDGIVGILATSGTIQAGVYQTRLSNRNCGFMAPEPDAQLEIMQAIRLVKAGNLAAAAEIFHEHARALIGRGCTTVAMACTEIPLALANAQSDIASYLIDPTDALARACVQVSGVSTATRAAQDNTR